MTVVSTETRCISKDTIEMSTRANIIFKNQGTTLLTVPVSSDGYPWVLGKNLVETLKKTDCSRIRENGVLLEFANEYIVPEPYVDYRYDVDVSGEEFQNAVFHGLRGELAFEGDLESFASWVDED